MRAHIVALSAFVFGLLALVAVYTSRKVARRNSTGWQHLCWTSTRASTEFR
jgi:hypothetical protein